MKAYSELKIRELSSKFPLRKIDVLQISRLDANIYHSGCVNTAKWYHTGEFLVTGSDDRTAKIWNVSSSALDNVRLKQSVPTKHRGNIFCAEISPLQSNTLVTAAADGVLYANHIDQCYPPSILHQSDELIHMFLFDVENGNIIYTAEESGHLHRIDLRVASSSSSSKELLFNYSGRSIKALAQCPYFGGSQLFMGGSGFHVGMFDLRVLRTTTNNESSTKDAFVRSWRPVDAAMEASANPSVSVSGLQISSDGRKILTSYQGDQIFIYDVLNSVENSESAAPYQSLGGHINYATFLKTVSFYGPRDEYVVSGSDSGHLWIWDSATGHAMNVLLADGRTCNGVIPHPVYPLLASYGIDSDVKLWCQQYPSQKDSEYEAPDNSHQCVDTRRTVGCSDLKRSADCLELKPSEELSTIPPVEAPAEVLQKLCRFGGRGDKFRYARVSVPLLVAGRQLLTQPAHLPYRNISLLFSLTELNKGSARSGLLDARFFRQESLHTSSKVYLLNNFNDVVKKCRSIDQFTFMLRSHQSGKDYSSFDSGAFMPSDFVDTILNAPIDSILRDDLTQFLGEHLAMPDSDSTCVANQVHLHAIRAINLFNYYQDERMEKNMNILSYCADHDTFPTRYKFLEFFLAPLYALFQVATRSKIAGNNAFKAGDLAIAHFFYLKACRYCRFILIFRQSEWQSRQWLSRRTMKNAVDSDLESDFQEDEYLLCGEEEEEVVAKREEEEEESTIGEDAEALKIQEDAKVEDSSKGRQQVYSSDARDEKRCADADPRHSPGTEKLDQQLSEQFIRKVVPELLKTVLTNMAVVLSKMSAFSDALNACSDAFSVVKKYSLPRDAKLLFRRGSALLSLKEFDAAVEDLDAASLLSPQDTAIATKLRDARKNLEAHRKQEMHKYSKMFN